MKIINQKKKLKLIIWQNKFYLLKQNDNIIKKEKNKFNESNEKEDNIQEKNNLLSKKILVKVNEINH